MAATAPQQGVVLPPLVCQVDESGNRTYQHVTLELDPDGRTATITVKAPTAPAPTDAAALRAEGANTWGFKAFREQEADEVNIRVAKWAVARSLRYLGREDESITILHDLVDEYSKTTESGSSGIPAEMLTLVRGMVFEELAEIYSAKGRGFARRAVEELSKNEMFVATEPKRLDRLRQLTLNPGS